MFDDSFGMEDSDRLIYARSSEGRSHLVDNGKIKNRYKVGDEVAIAAIVKITAIQPNRDGTVSYSFDRGFALHENTVEQMALKPYEKPIVEEVVEKPTYTGKVVATGTTELASALQNDMAGFRVGHVFEIVDGFIAGDRVSYGFAISPKSAFESFDDFAEHHKLNTWLELKS